MLQETTKEALKQSKNLLAFSAGGDSTALLFLLLQNNIAFDIAIVDYGLRLQSKEEVAYARELAHTYNFKCHLLEAPSIQSNFEAEARAIRYGFFETLIQKHSYNALLTAHHLGDRFEWMLMQFCKGAGCVELAGMQPREQRDSYTLYRPLLHLDKEELLSYLHKHNYKYFEDSSNNDEKYKRNRFRKQHAQPLLKEYKKGIQKSFSYIDEDCEMIIQKEAVQKFKGLVYFSNPHSKRSAIYIIDRYFKSQGQIITAHERALLKEKESVVIARKWIVSFMPKYIFIAPFMRVTKIDKKLKEKMRLLKIEPKLRPYLATDLDLVAFVSSLLA